MSDCMHDEGIYPTGECCKCERYVGEIIESIQKENEKLKSLLREGCVEINKALTSNGYGDILENFLNHPEIKALLEKDKA